MAGIAAEETAAWGPAGDVRPAAVVVGSATGLPALTGPMAACTCLSSVVKKADDQDSETEG